MISNDKIQSHRAQAFSSSQRKRHVVENVKKSQIPPLSNYRFVWIEPAKSNVPKIGRSVSRQSSDASACHIRPPLANNCSRRNHASIDSLIDYNDSREINNSSTTSLQYGSVASDNLLPKNKSYTIINILFDNVSENNTPCPLVEYKQIDAIEQPQNTNTFIEDQCSLRKKVEKNYKRSLAQNNKKCFWFENAQNTILSEDCSKTDCTEFDEMMENETSTQNNIESDMYECEKDDQYEIGVLNNEQLVIKTI